MEVEFPPLHADWMAASKHRTKTGITALVKERSASGLTSEKIGCVSQGQMFATKYKTSLLLGRMLAFGWVQVQPELRLVISSGNVHRNDLTFVFLFENWVDGPKKERLET